MMKIEYRITQDMVDRAQYYAKRRLFYQTVQLRDLPGAILLAVVLLGLLVTKVISWGTLAGLWIAMAGVDYLRKFFGKTAPLPTPVAFDDSDQLIDPDKLTLMFSEDVLHAQAGRDIYKYAFKEFRYLWKAKDMWLLWLKPKVRYFITSPHAVYILPTEFLTQEIQTFLETQCKQHKIPIVTI